MAKMMSGDVLGTTLEAVYHTGIVVHGREFWFGRGLQCAPAEQTQMQFGTPLRVDRLGTTEVDADLFHDFLREVSHRYTSETYNLLRHNCNNFSDEAARFLVGRGIDQKILDLPNVFLSTELGKALAPMLGMFEQRMRSTQGDSCIVVEDAVPDAASKPEPESAKPVSGIPELPKRASAKPKADVNSRASSTSASAENLANMVRSLSQTFNEYHERGENTQSATRAALSSALGELAKSQGEL